MPRYRIEYDILTHCIAEFESNDRVEAEEFLPEGHQTKFEQDAEVQEGSVEITELSD